jgi:hypothetical protein
LRYGRVKRHPADRERIETLFIASAADRSKAYELKRELDRLGVFAEYEDHFLDLFKKKSWGRIKTAATATAFASTCHPSLVPCSPSLIPGCRMQQPPFSRAAAI